VLDRLRNLAMTWPMCICPMVSGKVEVSCEEGLVLVAMGIEGNYEVLHMSIDTIGIFEYVLAHLPRKRWVLRSCKCSGFSVWME
jgi:hypothetical protein